MTSPYGSVHLGDAARKLRDVTSMHTAPAWIPFRPATSLPILLALLGSVALVLDLPRLPASGRNVDRGEANVCRDPIAGVWAAKRFLPELREWELVTLRIARHGNQLTGTITVRFWDGTERDSEPPECAPGVHDTIAHEHASGTFNGTSFTFEGTSVRVAETPCATNGTYNLDSFDGHLLPGGNTLEAVNNDGGRDVDAPHLFRRVRCTTE